MTSKHSLTPVDYYDITQHDEVTVTTPKRQVRFGCMCVWAGERAAYDNISLNK